MKKICILCLFVIGLACSVKAHTVGSPDGRLQLVLTVDDGSPLYQVVYDGQELVKPSPLGLLTNIGDYSRNLTLTGVDERHVSNRYELPNIKQRIVDYEANEAVAHMEQNGQAVMDIELRVSNRDVAFRYRLFPQSNGSSEPTRVCVVEGEASSFVLPEGTTTFLCPQVKPMGGFARSYPSYETPYTCDEPAGKNGWGVGYTFPCLFKVSSAGAAPAWVLISETGTDGDYVGCRLLNEQGTTYRIGFPQPEELNGTGSTSAAVGLPAVTPWRTVTVGSLANIVETTVSFDLVEPKYQASQQFVYGKGSWSWIMKMEPSCNFDEQRRYIDFSAAMGYQTVLVDALWDVQIGYDKVEELARYAREKGVSLFLWYNSNGAWNDAPQTPIGKMNNSRIRRQEMRWLQRIGIRGIKVDFFGGDKQPMMQLYEDILSDANDFGLMVIFHGCTLPRGWERMYPNYVASEAVLASENLHFRQDFCDAEAYNACLHPFIRNTVGSMDYGGSALNKHWSPDNTGGNTRRTSDVFALATAVLFQSAVQHFALAPNNLEDAPGWAIDFMKEVPTTWDEVRFLDGYPGRYIVLARRHGNQWYVAGVNAEQEAKRLTLSLPMLAGQTVSYYVDDPKKGSMLTQLKVDKKGQARIVIQPNGGIVLK